MPTTLRGETMIVMTSSQQQQRIDELTEAVNILIGHMAALMTYVAATCPPIADPMMAKGAAQRIAPVGIGTMPKTPPGRAAAEGIDRIVALAQQLQNPALP
jgi:hypothetical protein